MGVEMGPAEKEAARVAKLMVDECWEPEDYLANIYRLVLTYETERVCCDGRCSIPRYPQ